MLCARRLSLPVLAITCLVLGPALARPAGADELWVAPTNQADVGGLGIASNVVWPVTPSGAVRFAFPVPAELQEFRSARVALIPHASSGASTLTLYICAARDGTLVGISCTGPFNHPFTGTANQLKEIDVTTSVGSKIGPLGARNYLAVLAFTTPTTASDHFVGLRFAHGNESSPDLLNLGLGYRALGPSAGTNNTALGSLALLNGADGSSNTAVGTASLFGVGLTVSGSANTGVGAFALEQLSSGSRNTAVGASALREVHAATDNTAVGASANFNGGQFNTAVGSGALSANHESYNAAVGYQSLSSNSYGSRNTAMGAFALGGAPPGLPAGASSLGDGNSPFADGHDNVAIGFGAGSHATSGHHNIHIANLGEEERNTLRIGTPFKAISETGQNRAFIAGIRGVATGIPDGIPVLIDSAGQLGTVSSSRRFKEDIHDMADASRRVFQLRPVTFRYTRAFSDGSKPIQFGLIAEEVAKVFPELAVHGADGQVETVHYEKLSVLLLNELQRQERKMQEVLDRLAAIEGSGRVAKGN